MPERARVVVTGAAGGIGRAVVKRLVADGCDVVAADLDPGVAELASEAVVPIVGDLSAEAGVTAVRDALGDGPLAGLVNVAGITRDGLLRDLDDDRVRPVLRVNAVAPLRLTLALAGRIAEGGAVVSVASRAHLGNVGQVNYAASKGAVVGFTKALAGRLAPRLRVNAVAPGLVRTAMTEAMPAKVRDKLLARVPAERMGEPAEVAAAVAWLLGDDSRYVTGQTLYLCGGRSL